MVKDTEAKESKEDKVVIFPKVVKFSENFKPGVEDDEKELFAEKLTKHYAKHLILKLGHHGITMDQQFFRDIEITSQFLLATILRNVGIYHPMQTAIDQLYENVIRSKPEDEQDDSKPEEGQDDSS